MVLNSTGFAAETAVRYCQQLSEALDAKISVVDILPPVSDRWNHFLRSKYDLDTGEEIRQERVKELQEFLESKNVDWPVVVKRGTALIEISRLAVESHCELVVKPQLDEDSHMFGSLAKQLVRKCPTAVLLVKTSGKGKLQSIMAAIDPDPNFEEQEALNKSVLQLANALSSTIKGSLSVAAAWTIFAESYLRGPRMQISDAEFTELESDEKKKHHDMLLSLGKSIGIELKEEELFLTKGLPNLAVPYAAKKAKTDILVMGSIGRVGVPGLLIGNTAEKIIDSMKCSVLTLKPPGYKSPLKL